MSESSWGRGSVRLPGWLIGVFLACVAGPLMTILPHSSRILVDDWTQFLGGLAAGLWCLSKLYRSPELRRGYRLSLTWLACGFLCFAAGQLYWSIMEQVFHKETPFPSWGDLGFMLMYPCMLAGVLFLTPQRLGTQARLRLLLDSCLILAALLAVAWFCILGPGIDRPNGTLLEKLLGLAYPSGDVLLVACMLVVGHSNAKVGPAHRWFVLGLLTIIVIDVQFALQTQTGTYETGSLFDLCWPVGMLWVAYAAGRLVHIPPETDEQEAERLSRIARAPLWRSLLPLALLPPVGLLCLYAYRVSPSVVVQRGCLTSFVLLVIIVMLRQTMLMRESKDIQIRISDAKEQLEEMVLERTKALEEQLRISKDLADSAEIQKIRADAANLAKGQFLANVSHEMRTPLVGVIGLANVLNESQLSPADRENLEVLVESARSMLRVIDDVVTFSQIETSRIKLEEHEVDLPGLLSDACALFAGAAHVRGLEFRLVVHPESPRFVRGDEMRLRQILVHLIGNAMKFTTDGSVAVSYGNQDGAVKIDVSDTGVGIPEDQLHRIFASFTQAEYDITRKFGGLGLGLAICHQLIELMGGTLTVRSKSGVGTSVTLVVPLPVVEITRQAHVQVIEDAFPARARAVRDPEVAPEADILVVEDNPVNQRIILRILKDLPYSIDLASDGKEAVEKYRSGSYRFILMDLHMPHMDGFSASQAIRTFEAEATKPSVPIVAYTADILSATKGRCLEVGMNDCVSKPATKEALHRLIRGYVEENAA